MESIYIFFGTLFLAAVVFLIKSILYKPKKLKGKNKHEEKILKAQTVKPFVYRKSRSKTSASFYKEWFKNRYRKNRLYHIFMWLNNKNYTQFTVVTSEKEFIYQGGMYIIDTDLTREDVATGHTTLMYHQGISLPFLIDFNIDKLQKALQHKEDIEEGIIQALNPALIKEWKLSSVIQKILKGQEMTDALRFIKLMVVIGLLISGVNLIIMLKQGGVF